MTIRDHESESEARFFAAAQRHQGSRSASSAWAFTDTPLAGAQHAPCAVPGTLAPAKPLVAVPGRKYKIQFFHSSSYSGEIARMSRWCGMRTWP